MGAYHPAPEQNGWWAGIGLSWEIQSREMHARAACISDVGRPMISPYSQAPMYRGGLSWVGGRGRSPAVTLPMVCVLYRPGGNI